LEFSFDRSNDLQSRSNSATNSDSTQGQASAGDGIDTSQISNERLRKAIERNRARQAERMKNQPQQAFAQPQMQSQPPTQAQTQPENQAQATFGSTENAQPSMFDRPHRTTRVRVHERVHNSNVEAANTSAIVTRKSAARPDEADFTPIKRAPRKVTSQISYSTSGSATRNKKAKSMDPKLEKYLIRGSWIFCSFLVLRLFFASGGIMDFYSQKSLYQERLTELDRIKKENMQIVREIERMQTDAAFQKKLVRDNLGFIASDEFLVLFPKEKLVQ
jgi:cell division protein FtsB